MELSLKFYLILYMLRWVFLQLTLDKGNVFFAPIRLFPRIFCIHTIRSQFVSIRTRPIFSDDQKLGDLNNRC